MAERTSAGPLPRPQEGVSFVVLDEADLLFFPSNTKGYNIHKVLETIAAPVGSATPDSDGTAPDSDGTAPDSDGTAPDSDGTAPDSDGTARDREGAATDSDGTAPNSEGAARDREGAAAADGEGAAPVREGAMPRPQYIYCAATVPSFYKNPKKDLRRQINALSPGVAWVESDQLHRRCPALRHRLRIVTPGTRNAVLLQVMARARVQDDRHTLVFANSSESVVEAHKTLVDAGAAPSQHRATSPHPAIPEPRVGVPLPNPSFEPKTHRWQAPGREVPSQICAVLGGKQPFLAQNSRGTRSQWPNDGKWVAHVRLDLLVPKSLLASSNPTICPRNAPKRRQRPSEFA